MMEIQILTKILDINYPFTKQELTKAYRQKAFKHHPDKGGDVNVFMRIQGAYEDLLPYCSKEDTGQHDVLRTVEGIPLETLGKGLGSTVNGVTCSTCDGKGWIESTHINWLNSSKPCPVCDGKGAVRTIHNFDIFSVYSYKNWRPCKRCFGMGFIDTIYKKTKSYHVCYDCSGKGEKEIFNPVLQKGGVKGIQFKRTKHTNKKEYCSCGALLKNGKCWRKCKQEATQ